MRLLHFSDIHIGMENYSRLDPESGLSTRLLDFFKTFDFIVELALKEKVDAVLFAGDAYKTRDPNPTQQRGFGERIKRLAKNNIPVVLVVGNHDTPQAFGKANTLDIYSALEIDNVWVSRKPELLQVPTKSGDLQVITLPWLHKNDYQTIAERLRLLYEKVKPLPAGGPAVFLSHCEVEGASYGSEKGMAIQNDVTVPLPLLLDKRLNYVALGHIHKHQILSKDPLVVYSGSPQRIDFGEEKEEKGVCLIEIDGKSTNLRFIPTGARQFQTITVDLKANDQNPTQTVAREIAKHQIKDKIIRVIINIPADLMEDLQIDQIKRALGDAHFIAGISKNVERRERFAIRNPEEVERLTPIEALHKYFQAKKYASPKVKELEKYAAKLLE